MTLEYIAVRLRVMRAGFLPVKDIMSVADAQNPVAAAAVIGGSIFHDEIGAMQSLPGQKVTRAGLVRAVNEGYLNAVKKSFDIIRRVDPEIAEPLFSRIELEQVKYAMRSVQSASSMNDRRLRFVNLSRRSSWARNWRNFRNVSEFAGLLREAGHFLAPALKHAGSERQVDIETNLEKYYFGSYLPGASKRIGAASEYFSRQRDLVNIQFALLLGANRTDEQTLKECYIPGAGVAGFNDFARLAGLSGEQFAAEAGKIMRVNIGGKTPAHTAEIAASLKRESLRKERRQIFKKPFGIMEIPLFLEELHAFMSNLKTAILLGGAKTPKNEIERLLV